MNAFKSNIVELILELQVSPQSCWHCSPSLRSALLVPLDNRCWCRLCCGMSVWGCDASSGPQTTALFHARDVEAVGAPLRQPCPGHG